MTQSEAAASRHRRHRRNGEGRRRAVLLRLDEEEYAALAAAAESAGLTVTGYAASAAVSLARGSAPSFELPAAKALRELQRARGQVRMFARNVNQAVAALNATGAAPIWLHEAVETTSRAVARLEEAAVAAHRSLRVIGKITRGRGVSGLRRYLYGPGRHNEHVHPRLVAGFDDPAELEPRMTASGHRDFRRLINLLAGTAGHRADPSGRVPRRS